MKVQLIDKKFILFLTSLIICLSYSVRASALDYSFIEENPINGSKVEHYKFLLMRGKIEVGDYQKLKEQQYDYLADQLRRHLDMDQIYQIMEEWK